MRQGGSVAKNQKGRTDRTEDLLQTIYTERAAQVNRLGVATDTVRWYEKVRSRTAAHAR